jgi:DNA-binding GntR family transcriptional regulator
MPPEDSELFDLFGSASALDKEVMEWSSLRSRVYVMLKEAIASGRMTPGTVVTLRSLAAAMGTSSMPVREAVMRLVTEGAMELHPNRTFTITRLSPARFIEIRDTRIEIEGCAAERAATRISPEELDALQAVHAKVEHASLNPDSNYLALNRQFHFMIYKAARLPEMVAIIESLWLKYGPVLYYFSLKSDARSNGNAMHRAALKALGERNGPAAREAIAEDIRSATDAILPRLTADFETTKGVAGDKIRTRPAL